MLADLISGDLPYLRRYARALLGTRAAGDDAVEAMLETKILFLIEEGRSPTSRTALFRALDETIMEELTEGRLNQEMSKILKVMTADEHRALLLTAVEGFSVHETAEILGSTTEFVEVTLKQAEGSLKSALATSVLIIEDEALIATMLSRLVREAGHTVVGVATTREDAVRLARGREFGLILSDEVLADGSSGSAAVTDILSETQADVPVVFITAFPKRLLQGLADEPAYLISKPFQPQQVRAVAEQAVISSMMMAS
ncbi:MAG: response regulator [Hyphomonas sp.]|nr:response regulator [Hyphomonas sp.]